MINYGQCECGCGLEPVWFLEEEYDAKTYAKTGRKRKAVDVLTCPRCLKDYCVDDTFDGPWTY